MKKITASIKLAPGNRGFFDPITGINLSLSNSMGYIREDDDITNIKKAIREGKVKIVGGQLPPAINIKPIQKVKKVIKKKEEVKPVEVKKEEAKSEVKRDVKVENDVLYAPIKGRAIELSEVNDGVFSEGMLGKGIGIEPEEGRAVSPVNGTVSVVFDTKHAIGITSDDGVEVLIHVGLDTVQLNGQYYTTHVKVGDKVKVGDLLVEFDKDKIQEAGYRTVTPIIISNTDEFKNVKVLAKGEINEKAEMISVER